MKKPFGKLGKRTCLAFVMAMATVLVFAGCNMNLEVDVFLSDIESAGNGGSDSIVPATLAFEVVDADECESHTRNISEIFKEIISDFQPRGCIEEGIESYLLADIKAPFLDSSQGWSSHEKYLFGLVVSRSRKTNTRYGVTLLMNRDNYVLLKNRMVENFGGGHNVHIANSRISITVNNDINRPISLSVRDVFVDVARPAYKTERVVIEHREKVKITLSNVGSAYLEDQGHALMFISDFSALP